MSLATPNKRTPLETSNVVSTNTVTPTNIVTPVGRILLRELKVDKKTSGGIILTGDSDPQNKTRIGEVIYNGVTINGFKSDLYREGCTIHFGKHSGAVVIHDNEKYISITESEVAAISY